MTTDVQKVNIAEKLGTFDDLWHPKVVAELNGQWVKVVKLEGEYVWHAHEAEDEMFYVVSGHVDIHLRHKVVGLDPGELLVVPRGVEHKPVAQTLAHVLLFEPATTRSTGDVDEPRTVEAHEVERI